MRTLLAHPAALCAVAAIFASASANAQTPVYSATLRGELIVTGNTLGLDATDATTPGTGGGIGTFIAHPLLYAGEQDGAYPAGTTDDWHHNGSAAVLDLPDGATVAHAQLVWGCSSKVGGVPAEPLDAPASVKLRLPGGAVQTVAPDGSATDLSLVSDGYRYYLRWADVTATVQTGGGGEYLLSEVAGVQRTDASYVTTCGWTLFAVVADAALPMRNFNLWVTPEEVRYTGAGCPCDVQIEVAGFCTPEDADYAEGRLFVTAMEGDARFVADTLSIADPLFPGDFYPLSGPNNAWNNFFASQINDSDGVLDTRGTFGTVNHAVDPLDGAAYTLTPGARQGWDVSAVPLNDLEYNPLVLESGQTATQILVTTEGDDFILGAVGMQLDFDAPTVGAVVAADREGTFRGDVVTYTVTVYNEGSGTADAVALCLAPPANATLTGAIAVDGEPVPGATAATLDPAGCAADASGGLDLGALPPSSFVDVTVSYTVDHIAAAPSPLAWVTTTPTLRASWAPNCAGAPAETYTVNGDEAAIPGARLEVHLAATPTTPPALEADDVVTYTATIRNVGAAATPPSTTLTAVVPQGAAYVPGSARLNGAPIPGASFPLSTPGRLVQSPGAAPGVIAPGAAATVTYEVTITATEATTLAHAVTADLDGDGPAPPVASNEVMTAVTGATVSPQDLDGDGVVDAEDNCVSVPNPDQANHYDDSGWNPAAFDEGDACDDTDGDGLTDLLEDPDGDGPEAGETSATKADTDGDGLCDGNVQIAPCVGVEDTDGDGDPGDRGVSEPNPIDADTDGDGVCDGHFAGGACLGGEVDNGTSPLDTDSDDDGLCDGPGGGAWDDSGCVGDETRGDGVHNPGFDTDPADSDTDGDGLCDGFANGPAAACTGGEDTDGDADPADFDAAEDTETDPLDPDTDDGGVNDGVELTAGTNPRDKCDGDLITCSGGDLDEDGVPDTEDNCPTVANPDQADSYPTGAPNGKGDACDDVDKDGISDRAEDLGPDGVPGGADATDPEDADTDGDGLCDGNVQVPPCVGVEDTDGDFDGGDRGVTEPDPLNPDTDGDGICDGRFAGGACYTGEVTNGTSPLDTDSDGDGLCDGPGGGAWDGSGCVGDETRGDGVYDAGVETDPSDSDTDNDGLCDGPGGDATDCHGGEDLDGDGNPADYDEVGDSETNPLDADTDDGGVNDGRERDNGTNPLDPCDGDLLDCTAGDFDQDGVPDAEDNCPLIPNPGQADSYPSGAPNGVGDACDDVDQDGIVDRAEARGPDDSYGTGDETDPEDPDTDGDGLCDGNAQVAPCVGVEDTDGDFDRGDRGTTEPDPTNPDTDGDGVCDGVAAGGACLGGERDNLTSPLDTDSDDDGLCDGPGGGAWDGSGCVGDETGGDGVYDGGVDTNPANPDTDADGLCDGPNPQGRAEGCVGGEDLDGDRDPADYDAPEDVETNPLARDTDGGGVDDGTEVTQGTNPTDPCDGDGQVCAGPEPSVTDLRLEGGGGCAGGGGPAGGALAGLLALLLAAARRRVPFTSGTR